MRHNKDILWKGLLEWVFDYLLTGKKYTMDIFEQVREMRIEEARQEGQKEAREAIVHDLLNGTKFSDEKIASLTHVRVTRVAAIRKKLRK